MVPGLQSVARQAARLRSLASFWFVAFAQFLSPAAAADPASKIDPPAWSHRHSQQEIQAYAARTTAREPEKRSYRTPAQVRLRLQLQHPPPLR